MIKKYIVIPEYRIFLKKDHSNRWEPAMVYDQKNKGWVQLKTWHVKRNYKNLERLAKFEKKKLFAYSTIEELISSRYEEFL